MKKPTNYDELIVNEHIPVRPGGHSMTIINTQETLSRTGKPMLVIWFDFDEQDDQAGIFSKMAGTLSASDEPAWPTEGTGYVLLTDEADQCTRMCKSFIQAVERSNPDFQMEWVDGPEFSRQFLGRKIGGVFGNVEEYYKGRALNRRKLRWFCSNDAAAYAPVPGDKRSSAPLPERPGMDETREEDNPYD